MCAVALVSVSSAHAMNHFESFDVKPKAEVAVSLDADSTAGHGEQEPAGASDNHDFCGCCAMAFLDIVLTIEAFRRSSLVSDSAGALQRRGPSIDTPYPIIAI
jgi:hypothetical protein